MLKNTYTNDGHSLLTKGELADRLKVSTRTIDLWVKERLIPKIKINSSARFDWVDVVAALKEQNSSKTNP
jgi:hypothetical protein